MAAASVLGLIAITLSACSGGGTASPSAQSSTPAASTAAVPRPVSSAAAARSPSIGGTSPPPIPARPIAGMANAYTAAHPNVKINITVLENEAFKTKLQTTTQSGDIPDLFQSWGGGTMREQADAGLLKDITADVAPWKDKINPGAMSIYQYNGKQYGDPVGPGHLRRLVQQGPVHQGRHHRAARDVGPSSSPPSTSSRPPASPRSRWASRTSGRACISGR